MLRVFLVLVVTLAMVGSLAGPVLAEDMEICRDKQTEAKARLDACEKVLAAGKAAGKDVTGKDVTAKDLAVAYELRSYGDSALN